MVSNNKSNFNQALWLSIGYVCSMAVGILSSVILSRYFSKTEYGTYKQIMYVYQIMFSVFQAGLPAVFTYFLPRYSREEGKFIVKKINSLLFIMGFCCSLLLFFLADFLANLLKNPELSIGLKIFSFFPLFTLPTLGVEGIYTVNKNTLFVAKYNVFTRLLMLVCIIVPVLFVKNDYRYALVGWGVASFIAFIIAMVAKTRVYNSVKEVEIPNIFHDVFRYTIPIMGSSIVFMAFNSASQFFISRYYGTEAFAEYSNGYMTLPFAPIFIAPIRILLTPIFAKASANKDYARAMETLYSSTKQIFILLVPLIFFAFAYSREIMSFLYGDAYINSFIYFRIILMFNFAEMFVFSSVMNAIGRTKQRFYFDILCTVLLWVADCYLVYSGSGNPYLIAAAFAFLNTSCSYLLPGLYLYKKEHICVLSMDLIKTLLKICLHNCVVLVCVYKIICFYDIMSNPLVCLCLSLLLFYILLILTSRVVNVDYLQVVLRFKKR